MESSNITEWLAWRYKEVWKDFKEFMIQDELYIRKKDLHKQPNCLLIIHKYFKRYNIKCTSLNLDKPMRKAFSHINLILK
jgi:hypothetical protein